MYNQTTSIMHNLKSSFDKFLNIIKSVFKNCIRQFDNFYYYKNKTLHFKAKMVPILVGTLSLFFTQCTSVNKQGKFNSLLTVLDIIDTSIIQETGAEVAVVKHGQSNAW